MKEPLSPPTSSEALPPGVARDPVRLLAGGGSAFERGLLESVAGDRISQASEQRLAQLFELPQAQPIEAGQRSTAAEVVPGAATRVGQLATRAGWGALGLVAAFLTSRGPAPAPSAERAAAALAATATPGSAAPTTAAPTLARLVDPAPALGAPISPEPATRPGLQAATASHAVSRAAAPKPRRAARSRPKPTPAATADGSLHGLRAELRLLEGAKVALREGRANAAADTLSDHARRFPAGELAVEAELLRIDLALVRGERSRAAATARRLLALPSAAQYRERLEALLRNNEAHAADGAVGVKRAGTDMKKRRSFR